MDPNEFRRRRTEASGGSGGDIAVARAQSNPRTAAMKHGGYAPGIRICTENCPLAIAGHCDAAACGHECPHERARFAAVREAYHRAVIEDGILDPEIAAPLINDAALRLIAYERLRAWAAIMPEVTSLNAATGTFEIQSGHLALDRFAQSWERALDLLGLSHAARLKIDAERQQNNVNGLAAIIMQAQGAIKGPAEPVDAEFEEDGDPPPLGGTGGDGEPHP